MPPPLLPSAVLELAAVQQQVVSRAQLRRLGVSLDRELAQLEARRWRAIAPLAVVLHNGPLTDAQRRWVAVVNAGPGAALCAFTALVVDGLAGWERSAIEVIVPRGSAAASGGGVKVHESRRFDPVAHVHPGRLPPRTRPARSAVDAATWSRSPRTAVGVLAAVVQQGLVRPGELAAELEAAGRIRYRRLLARAVEDIGGGAHALSEIDFVRLCRRYGLPAPFQQSVRVEQSGRRRYLDAEWVLTGGRRVVAEVDGAVHLLPRRYWDDMERANELVLDGRVLLRFAAFAVRVHEDRVAGQLARALGVPLVRASQGQRPGSL